MRKYPKACIFQSRDFFTSLVFTKLVIYGAKEGRNRNMRIILVKDRLSYISKSIYVLYRKYSLLLNLPSANICCFLLEFFTTTCFSHFSESQISMKSAVYLIRLYPFLCVQQIKILAVTMLLYDSATYHLHITQHSIKIDKERDQIY